MKTFNDDPRIAAATALAKEVVAYIQAESGQEYCTFAVDAVASGFASGLTVAVNFEAYAGGHVIHGDSVDAALQLCLQPDEKGVREELTKVEAAADVLRSTLARLTGSKLAECCPECQEAPAVERGSAESPIVPTVGAD